MEQNQDSSLFGLTIDTNSRNHLWDTARWAKFLAVMGFIGCALLVIFGFLTASVYERSVSDFDVRRNDIVNTHGVGVGMAVMYTIVAVVYLFPCLFLFNFATKMKIALVSNDQNTLTTSFQNLKKMFRFMGVLTIIGLVLFLISLVVMVTTRMPMNY
jgi:hypothetical protein